MKTSQLIKMIPIFIITVSLIPPTAWAKKEPTLVSPTQMRFEPKKKYVIEIKDSKKTIRTKGKNVEISGDTLIIKNPNNGNVQEIEVTSVKTLKATWGSHPFLGMGLGALSGGAIGAGIALSTSCDQPDSFGCGLEKAVIVPIGLISGVVGGGLIGMAVGSAVKKEEVYIFSPIISPMANNQTYGLGMTKIF